MGDAKAMTSIMDRLNRNMIDSFVVETTRG
jgi:hypothetical protein